MTKQYTPLSLEERNKISILQCEVKSIRSIAKTLGRNVSTVQRELDRKEVDRYSV